MTQQQKIKTYSVLMPGKQGGEKFPCYTFSALDFLNLSRDYLENLIKVAKSAKASHVTISDAKDFDIKEISSVLKEYDFLDAIWGLFFKKEGNNVQIEISQAMALEGGAELGAMGFNALSSLDHIVDVNAIERYLESNVDVSLLSYFQYLWINCSVQKIPVKLWLKDANAALNLNKELMVKYGLSDISKPLAKLAAKFTGEQALQIKNKNLYEAVRIFKKFNLPVDQTNHFSLSSSYPFHGYVDYPLKNRAPITLFSNGDDIICNSLVWLKAYEAASASLWCWLLRERAYDFCLDIGAYDGFYGLIAARILLHKPVHLFEPLHANYARCVLNKNTNKLNNLIVHPVAISDQEGFTQFNIFSNESFLTSGGSLVDGHKGATTKKFPVYTNSIDNILPELKDAASGLVKIDVEGVELQALKGMSLLIAEKKIDVLLEVTAGDDIAEIHSIFIEHGYHLYEIDEKAMQINPKQALEPANDRHTLNKIYLREALSRSQRRALLRD